MKISVQSQNLVREFGAESAYRMMREAGFEAVDWNIDHGWKFSEVLKAPGLEGLSIFEKPIDDILEYYSEELAQIRKNGLTVSQAHAPFPPYATGREDILEYAIGIYQNCIRLCQAVGCKNLIIHGISRSVGDTDMTDERYEELNMRLYEALIPVLSQTDVVVCLENIFTGATRLGNYNFYEGVCSNPHVAAEWIDRLNEKAGKTCFGLCLDTGHLNLLRKLPNSYIPIVGNRICALHIHDNMQSFDSHLMPYTGSIQWSEMLKELRAIGYQGDLSFETFGQTGTQRLPRELVPVFLRTIAEIGHYFKRELQA